MAIKDALPRDINQRLLGLGDAVAAASDAILFAYLFGSAATGTLTPRSDIDIAIQAAPGADLHDVRLTVMRAATRQLGTDAVDVVVLNTAPIALAGRVLGSRLVLLDREPFARPLRIAAGAAVPGLSHPRTPDPRRACRSLLVAT